MAESVIALSMILAIIGYQAAMKSLRASRSPY